MASNLRVDNIQPSTGMGIGIGTANGSVTFNADVTGGLNVSTGLVGVGTNIPSTTLDVVGSSVPVVINSSNSNTYKIQLENAGSTVAYIGAATSEIYFANADAVEQARFTDNGLRFPSGKGIDFSATGGPANGTGTSELLEDYEEGTWTPAAFLSYNPSGTKSVSTGSNPTGQYVKVGKVVTAWFHLPYTLSGTGTYNMGVNGLPFTADTVLSTVCGGARESSSTGYWYQCESVTGTTIQVLRRYDNGGAYDGTATMYGFVTYRAA